METVFNFCFFLYFPVISVLITKLSIVLSSIGHEKDDTWIIDQLLDEHEFELDVISIVRMPRLSKTTLANKVFNNTLVASHFNVRAWCTVSISIISQRCYGKFFSKLLA
ncbi:hypothetical protein MTR67_016404 [Solanum verrucosum]|uniref:NB-ARC domain-containing protein n=1 Tax=Solanum verrucosum TaxID=315347 RepID=A0AAF0TKX3_SOLVR|nr:hypothetical protein MTR67_016404 [Solanum verrucosum]